MTEQPDQPHAKLELIFHEPHRLAIMSELLGSPDGLAFNELKMRCRLTDGNLNRHLHHLEKAGAVRIEKDFLRNRPRTTIHLSPRGREHFFEYLKALEAVLLNAAEKLPAGERESGRPFPGLIKPVDA